MSNTLTTTFTVRPGAADYTVADDQWTDQLAPGDIAYRSAPIGYTGDVWYNAFDGDVIRVDDITTATGEVVRQVVSDIGILDVPQGSRLTIVYRGNREAFRAAQAVTR